MRERSGTKSSQTLAKGHVLFQRRLGTAAMPIKGGTQETKFQRLLSLELHATQKRLERPKGERRRGGTTQNWHRHAGRRGERSRRGTSSLTALRTGGPHQAQEQVGGGRPGHSRAGARWQGTEGDGQSQPMPNCRHGNPALQGNPLLC